MRYQSSLVSAGSMAPRRSLSTPSNTAARLVTFSRATRMQLCSFPNPRRSKERINKENCKEQCERRASRANHAPFSAFFPGAPFPRPPSLPSFTPPPLFPSLHPLHQPIAHTQQPTTTCFFAQLEISFSTPLTYFFVDPSKQQLQQRQQQQEAAATTSPQQTASPPPTYPSIMDMDSSFTVVIISPTHSPHRFTLDLASKSTILQLKDFIALRLQDGADTLLTATDQRLIYGGRILEDSETLDSIFEKVSSRSLLTDKKTSNSHSSNSFPVIPFQVDCSNAPTIHLVVSQRHVSGSGQQQQQRTSAPGTPSPLRFRMQSDREHGASTGSRNHSADNGISSNTSATSATNLNLPNLFTPMTRSSSEPLSALPFRATVSGTATSAAAQPKQVSATPVPQFAPSLLPLQHVLVK